MEFFWPPLRPAQRQIFISFCSVLCDVVDACYGSVDACGTPSGANNTPGIRPSLWRPHADEKNPPLLINKPVLFATVQFDQGTFARATSKNIFICQFRARNIGTRPKSVFRVRGQVLKLRVGVFKRTESACFCSVFICCFSVYCGLIKSSIVHFHLP